MNWKHIGTILPLLVFLAALPGCQSQAAEEQPPQAAPTEELEEAAMVDPPRASEQPETPFAFTRDNFPRLDGSTSTAPLGRAVAATLLGENEEEIGARIDFSRTTASFRALMRGEADLLLVAEPNAEVFDEMEATHFEVSMEPFATDALVFVVNEANPVESLTSEQIKDIYAGEITNWSQVGGDDLEIVPFQRNEDAGSQALLKKLVMGDTPLMEPPEHYVVDSMMGLMEAVRSYDNSPGAIGYSVYYYAHDMEMAQGLKLLAVDGTSPAAESIRDGSYPFRNPYYVVMSANTPAGSPASALYHWMLSGEGQALVDQEGYVPVLALPEDRAEEADMAPPKRLHPGPLQDLRPGSYGAVLPYIGGEQKVMSSYISEAGDPDYYTEYLYGLCTTDGTILTDPVYSSVSRLTLYDGADDQIRPLPAWSVSRVQQDADGMYYTAVGLLAAVGSWYTGPIYRSGQLTATGDSVLVSCGDDTAALVSLTDGSEIARYSGSDFLPTEHDLAGWLFTDGMGGFSGTADGYLRFDPSWMGLDEPSLWIDGHTGAFLDGALALPVEDGIDRTYFDGGWYLYGDYPEGSELTLHYDDGTEEVIVLPSGFGTLSEASSRYLIFYNWDEATKTGTQTLTDHALNVLFTSTKDAVWLFRDDLTGATYPCCYKMDMESGRYDYILLNEDGAELASSLIYPILTDGYLTTVNDDAYRLLDLNNGVQEILRIPRWDTLDFPGEQEPAKDPPAHAG